MKKPVRHIHTVVVSTNIDDGHMWEGESPHTVAFHHAASGQDLLADIEYGDSDVKVLHHPAQILEEDPSVVVFTSLPRGSGLLAKRLRAAGVRVANASVWHEELAWLPHTAQNLINETFKPNQVRRYVREGSEALPMTLKHPEAKFFIHYGVPGLLEAETSNANKASQMVPSLPLLESWGEEYAPLCLSLVGVFSRAKPTEGEEPTSGDFLRPGLLFVDNSSYIERGLVVPEGHTLEKFFNPSLAKALSSLGYSGVVRLQLTWSRERGWSIYNVTSQLEPWQWRWWCRNIAADQSWHHLWYSVGKWANFFFRMRNPITQNPPAITFNPNLHYRPPTAHDISYWVQLKELAEVEALDFYPDRASAVEIPTNEEKEGETECLALQESPQ